MKRFSTIGLVLAAVLAFGVYNGPFLAAGLAFAGVLMAKGPVPLSFALFAMVATISIQRRWRELGGLAGALMLSEPIGQLFTGAFSGFELAQAALFTVGGLAFYALDRRVRYAHFVWHLFVLAGTACHFIAVLVYYHA